MCTIAVGLYMVYAFYGDGDFRILGRLDEALATKIPQRVLQTLDAAPHKFRDGQEGEARLVGASPSHVVESAQYEGTEFELINAMTI